MELYNLSWTDWSNIIDEWVFNERDREILKRRLLDGLTYKELQDEFNLSIDRLKRIIYQGQNKIFKHI